MQHQAPGTQVEPGQEEKDKRAQQRATMNRVNPKEDVPGLGTWKHVDGSPATAPVPEGMMVGTGKLPIQLTPGIYAVEVDENDLLPETLRESAKKINPHPAKKTFHFRIDENNNIIPTDAKTKNYIQVFNDASARLQLRGYKQLGFTGVTINFRNATEPKDINLDNLEKQFNVMLQEKMPLNGGVNFKLAEDRIAELKAKGDKQGVRMAMMMEQLKGMDTPERKRERDNKALTTDTTNLKTATTSLDTAVKELKNPGLDKLPEKIAEVEKQAKELETKVTEIQKGLDKSKPEEEIAKKYEEKLKDVHDKLEDLVKQPDGIIQKKIDDPASTPDQKRELEGLRGKLNQNLEKVKEAEKVANNLANPPAPQQQAAPRPGS